MKLKTIVDNVANKVLHVDPSERYRMQSKGLDTKAQQTLGQVYLEDEPTVQQWLGTLLPTKKGAAEYVRELFPFTGWAPRYNMRWLMGDVVAGTTVGLVVVPQALAYALLAKLSPEYGLYTSFVGAATYWVFGTSKDIVIGTTAVGSLLVGSTITAIEESHPGVYTSAEIAAALSLIAGMVLLGIGLLRLGWIVDFIPYTSISAFVTAAAITIMSTQLPVALGITGINTREAPYKVIISTLKGLGRTDLDAAIGISSILLLFVIKTSCVQLEVRRPSRKRLWGIISSLRFTLTIVLFTLVSYLVNRRMPRDETRFRLVGKIEAGFRHAGIPRFDRELAVLLLPKLPAVLIILVIEHIAIAKSFGRIFGYAVTPSQEIMAQGVANLFGPFVGGYVCTGSFGASAVLSKAGVRTPLAGVVSALVLVLALYALTAVFAFIPVAVLAGLIIHATSDLLTSPRSLYKYWQLSPFELLIWVVGLVVALFHSLEVSIYVTTGLSLGLLLARMARTPGSFLGRVRFYMVPASGEGTAASGSSGVSRAVVDNTVTTADNETTKSYDAFLSMRRDDGSNPNVPLETPYPGIFIYRFAETLNYTNQAQHVDLMASCIKSRTRRTTPEDTSATASDRLWNIQGPRPARQTATSSPCSDGDGPPTSAPAAEGPPPLRAVVLDCSAVNNMDITSVQGLVDLRATLARHAAPSPVEWHLAGVRNRWARRALAVAGFGFPPAVTGGDGPVALERWSPTYAVAGSLASAGAEPTVRLGDEEKSGRNSAPGNSEGACGRALHSVTSVDRPFFHVGLAEAVDVAVRNTEARDQPRQESN